MDGKDEARWAPRPFLTGHFDSVNDFAWAVDGSDYLLSVSSDQTCRLFSSVPSSRLGPSPAILTFYVTNNIILLLIVVFLGLRFRDLKSTDTT